MTTQDDVDAAAPDRDAAADLHTRERVSAEVRPRVSSAQRRSRVPVSMVSRRAANSWPTSSALWRSAAMHKMPTWEPDWAYRVRPSRTDRQTARRLLGARQVDAGDGEVGAHRHEDDGLFGLEAEEMGMAAISSSGSGLRVSCSLAVPGELSRRWQEFGQVGGQRR